MQARFYAQDRKNPDKKPFRYDIIVLPDKQVSGEFFVEHLYSNGDEFRHRAELIKGASEKQVLESELNKAYSKFSDSLYIKKKITHTEIQKNIDKIKELKDAKKLGF